MLITDHELPFGVAPDGRLVPVNTVSRGLACNCRCPKCNRRLIARQGDVLVHHFAHEADAGCKGAFESMVHKLAKQVIADAGAVVVPPLVAQHGDHRQLVSPARKLLLTEVRLEAWQKGFRPDVIARYGDRELAIEIYVTHRCPPEKLAMVQLRGLPTLEIDLSARDVGDDFAEQVIERANRRWLFNPRQDEADADLGARMRAEVERLREAEEQRKLKQEQDRRRKLAQEDKRQRALRRTWTVDDIGISSRHDVAHEVETMRTMAAALTQWQRGCVDSISCDSNATADYQIELWTTSDSTAREIAEAIGEWLKVNRGGYNGLVVNFPGEHSIDMGVGWLEPMTLSTTGQILTDGRERIDALLGNGCPGGDRCCSASLTLRPVGSGFAIYLQCDDCGTSIGSPQPRKLHPDWRSYPAWRTRPASLMTTDDGR
jgi:hypothetical protein